MTTATASPSAQLTKRKEKVEKARARAREARDRKSAYEAEVANLRARLDQAKPDSAEPRDLASMVGPPSLTKSSPPKSSSPSPARWATTRPTSGRSGHERADTTRAPAGPAG
jgi:hypothetical protein